MSAHLTERQIAMLAEMGVAVVRPLVRAEPSAPEAKPATRYAAPPAAPKDATLPVAEGAVRPPLPLPKEWHALNWQGLQARCKQCQDCLWGQTPQRTGWGYFLRGEHLSDPSPRADLLIVIEPPDEASDAQGQLLGPPGHPAREMLEGMVSAMVQKLADSPTPLQRVFITSVTKCKPPLGATLARESIEACRPYLDRSIALLRPAFILALGSVAGKALLLGQDGGGKQAQAPVQRVRGQIRWYQGVPWLASMPVQHLVREPQQKKVAWEDLKAVIRYLQTQNKNDSDHSSIATGDPASTPS